MAQQVLRPVRFIWRDLTCSGRIVNGWRLQGRWWDAERCAGRVSYRYGRLIANNHQVFDLFRDDAKDRLWILHRIHD